MRTCCLLTLLILPTISFAQTKEVQAALDAKLQTLKYVASLHDPATGAYKPDAAGKPGLRATSAAVRSWNYLGGEKTGSPFPGKEKAAAFVAACFDPKTGGFADTPGGKADVTTTAVGVMAAAEFAIPKEKYAKAMDYLKANAKTFEEIRLGAAAVEAWGVKDCPFDLKPWFEVAGKYFAAAGGIPVAKDGGAREAGSLAAMYLRLGMPLSQPNAAPQVLRDGQLADGGWGKMGAKGSDGETTYRVMRAFHLLKTKPNDVAKLREFLGKCRNADGGYGAAPGQPSSVGGVYYVAIVTKWLDEMEK